MVRQGRSVRAEVLKGCAVFAAAFLYLSWGAGGETIAAGYTDPVHKIRTQDDAIYSSIAIGMAERGDFLTPRFMDRLSFGKPVLAYMPPALLVKLLGPSVFSLRLWALLCGAGVLTLIWFWQGPAAAMLLAGNHMFFTLARRNMTDVPLLFFTALALWLWTRRPAGAGGALGAGLLIKSVAAVPPALVMLFADRRNWIRIVLLAAVVAAPWHLYQLGVNTDWYWKEHILDEHLRWGLAAPGQTSAETHLRFYALRGWAIDPVLFALLPWALWKWRRVESGWLLVNLVLLFGFSYRNPTYLLPVYGAAALAPVHPALAGAALAGKVFAGDAVWGVRHAPDPPVPALPALGEYCEMGRGNGLLLYGLGDEFNATVLPLGRVQYILEGDEKLGTGLNIDYRALGIVRGAGEYLRDKEAPAPAASLIVVRNVEELREVIAGSPGRDILLPEAFRHAVESDAHEKSAPRVGYFLMLSRTRQPGRGDLRDRCRALAPGWNELPR
jgi:4-amino-4-deoxy-L-arabinose transferase-like glycosyltransferase